MATMNSPSPEDDYADLFDYDATIPDLDIGTPPPDPEKSTPGASNAKKDTLGIDEEVKIRKKRVTVRLDEERLLSDAGIPKLRREAPKRLRFKGKGHEYRDAARLLQFYQLWADDLFKKARFKDTLTIIEKLGHSKGMKERRLVWIDEAREAKRRRTTSGSPPPGITNKGKGKEVEDGENEERRNDDDLYELPPRLKDATNGGGGKTGGDGVMDGHASSSALFLLGTEDEESEDELGRPDDEELDALMDAALRTSATAAAEVGKRSEADGSGSESGKGGGEAGKEKEKEVNKGKGKEKAVPVRDEFEDEMEAMADMEDMEDW